jgi:hypothetical protein
MSTPISIFINSSSAFENTALEIEKALSLKYRYGGLGLTITLFGNHGLEDDKGIPFSHYQYEMDFDVIRKDIEAKIWENLQYYAAMYKRIITELKYPTMVVDNLQKMIATYP